MRSCHSWITFFFTIKSLSASSSIWMAEEFGLAKNRPRAVIERLPISTPTDALIKKHARELISTQFNCLCKNYYCQRSFWLLMRCIRVSCTNAMPFSQSSTLVLFKVNAKALFNRHSLFLFHFFMYWQWMWGWCLPTLHAQSYRIFLNQPVVVPFAFISLFQIEISFYVMGFSDAILRCFSVQWDDIYNVASLVERWK